MEPLNQEYMPLSGEELLEVIKRKIPKLLAKYNQYFGSHLAYHNPWIRLAVKVDCYTPERTPTDGGFEVIIDVCEGIVMEPDRVRDELGLGVYETKLVDEYSGTLAQVKVGERKESPDPAATLAKVAKLLEPAAPTVEEEPKRPRPRGKTKRTMKHIGWPKGKPRGPRKPSIPIEAVEAS